MPITEIKLNFNMDGLPTYKSSKTEFWPILMSIANYDTVSPMVVAIYSGTSKPPSADEFLKTFVDEFKDLTQNGVFINNCCYKTSINAFICDTPARAFIKCMFLLHAVLVKSNSFQLEFIIRCCKS